MKLFGNLLAILSLLSISVVSYGQTPSPTMSPSPSASPSPSPSPSPTPPSYEFTSSRDQSRVADNIRVAGYEVTQENSSTAILNAQALVNGVTTLTTGWVPQVPRNVTFTVTDGAATGVVVEIEITGLDQFGNLQVETIGNIRGTTFLTFTSSSIWLLISQIKFTNSGVAGTDTINMGLGRKLGFGVDLRYLGDEIAANLNLKTLIRSGSNIFSTSTVDVVNDSITPPAGLLAGDFILFVKIQ